jgi:hypothetical protein
LNEADWAQFRELVTGVGEGELAAVLRDYAALLRPVTMGEEEFAVILRDYAAFLRNGRPNEEPTLPLKTTGLTPIRGILAEDGGNLAAFSTFPELTPEERAEGKAEAEWEDKLFKAIESGEIGRGKPGRRPVCPGYLARAQERLDEADGNFARARETFIEQQMKAQNITRKTAENRWAEAMKTLFPER